VVRLRDIVIFLIVIFLVSGGIYIFIRLDSFKKQTSVLKSEKEVLIGEKEQLQLDLKQANNKNATKEATIATLSKELAGLQDVKKIRDSYVANKEELYKLNIGYNKVKDEYSRVQQTNLTLNTRLANLNKEFSKALDEVRDLKLQLSKSKGNRQVKTYMKKLERTEERLKKREEEIKQLKRENKKLSRNGLEKTNKKLEKKIAQLEEDKQKLKDQIESVRTDFNMQQRVNAKLKIEMAQLKKQLKDREKEKIKLNSEIDQLNEYKKRLAEKLDLQDEKISELQKELIESGGGFLQIRKIRQEKSCLEEELRDAQKKLGEQEAVIARLEKTKGDIRLNEAYPSESGTTRELQDNLNKAYALYDTAKAQVVKFSELLMNKEIELESMKQKVKDLEGELASLKQQRGLATNESSDKRYEMLRGRIKELNAALLEKDIELKRKDEEISVLSLAKSTIEERANYQEKEYQDSKALYSNLKKQLLQATDLLTRKQSEIDEKNKEILGLKSELAVLKTEHEIKIQEFEKIQNQQRKTIEDLTRTSLGAQLEENTTMPSVVQSFASDEKTKAEKLKKELELLMGK